MINNFTNQTTDDSSTKVTYSWHSLNAYVQKKTIWGKVESKSHILKDVSGICRPGELLAIMGSSGAGKTTLMDTLTHRPSRMKISGDIRLNGKKIQEARELAGVAAYVQQIDLFSRVFTVREQLEFIAQLRIGRTVSEIEKHRRIEQVLNDLGLRKCEDTLIGEPGRVKGISGGEKKRLALGCELLMNPMLLFCDEPTSGIDSFMSLSVVNVMKEMTRRGKTVISTIHQPSSEIFHMFDHIQILAEGRMAFSGTRDEAHAFFNRIHHPCPQNFNPADHYVQTLAIKPGTREADLEKIHKICDEFQRNESRIITEETNVESNKCFSSPSSSKSPYKSGFCDQFFALFRRSFYEIAREPWPTYVKLFQTVFYAFLLSIIYFDQDPESKFGRQNIMGLLFVQVTNLVYPFVVPVLNVFSREMPLFLREHGTGLYRCDVYFLSRNMVELPLFFFLPVLSTIITYYMTGLRPEAIYFFRAIILSVLIANTSVSFGYLLSCACDNLSTALMLYLPLLLPLLVFAGFYMSIDAIPDYISWLKYLSWFMYGLEGYSINQWDGFTQQIEGTNATIPSGNYILKAYGFNPSHFELDFWGMIVLVVVLRILAFFFLLLKTYRKSYK